MKSKKQLQALYNKIPNRNEWDTFENFYSIAKQFIKDIKLGRVVCSMKVSKSGMTRHFNFKTYNGLLNQVFHNKNIHDPVKIEGCGIDMHWYLLFRVCEKLCTKREIEKYHLNMRCSRQTVL